MFDVLTNKSVGKAIMVSKMRKARRCHVPRNRQTDNDTSFSDIRSDNQLAVRNAVTGKVALGPWGNSMVMELVDDLPIEGNAKSASAWDCCTDILEENENFHCTVGDHKRIQALDAKKKASLKIDSGKLAFGKRGIAHVSSPQLKQPQNSC